MPPWKILPERSEAYPLALKCCGIVTKSGCVVRKAARLSRMPVVVGYRPVSIDDRDGLQRGNWQYARSNRTPVAASASMWGVLPSGLP